MHNAISKMLAVCQVALLAIALLLVASKLYPLSGITVQMLISSTHA